MHHLVGMAEIAEILGVSRQRVAQLIETYEDFPKPEVELTEDRVWSRTAIGTWIASHPERGPGRAEEGDAKKKRRFFGDAFNFTRFTDLARGAVIKAQEEARLLDHNFIGTEHLLLGLMAVRDGVAYHALTHLGLSLEGLRVKVVEIIGRGPETPSGHIPFTPRAKKVLELALREALHLKHNYIGTEHVLLAVVREAEGAAAQALVQLGAELPVVRATVLARLEGFVTAEAEPAPTAETAPTMEEKCSFCGKQRGEITKLIAGPGVYICDECVALCDSIMEDQGVTTEALRRERTLTLRLEELERRLEDLEKK